MLPYTKILLYMLPLAFHSVHLSEGLEGKKYLIMADAQQEFFLVALASGQECED